MKLLWICVFGGLLAAMPLARPVAAVCGGDCDHDGEVSVDEIIVAVSIALGSADAEQCTAVDADHDRQVTVDEIIGAVNAALSGCPSIPPRLLALSREGRVASIDTVDPWEVRATSDLGATIASTRCRAGRCLVVHPEPFNTISVIDAADLTLLDAIVLGKGSDPRDVALVDDRTAVVSQYGSAELLVVDLPTATVSAIDLSELADEDGLPEMLRLAYCGRRVFAQLLRVDHESGARAAIPAAIAVIDLDAEGADKVVDADPATPGRQGVPLAGRPNFDMPVDCEAGILPIAEPALLMQGGGSYEQVDLTTLQASELPIDTGAEVGGFEYVEPGVYWLITHTTTGPAPSSHLNIIGGDTPDTYNTFSPEHVDDLALDRDDDLLFFPDPCDPARVVGCVTGVQAFHAHTGFRATTTAIDVGFAPIEVTLSR